METQHISALTPSIFMEQYLTAGMKWCHQTVATLPCHHFLRANGKSWILPWRNRPSMDTTGVASGYLRVRYGIHGTFTDDPSYHASIYTYVPWLC